MEIHKLHFYIKVRKKNTTVEVGKENNNTEWKNYFFSCAQSSHFVRLHTSCKVGKLL